MPDPTFSDVDTQVTAIATETTAKGNTKTRVANAIGYLKTAVVNALTGKAASDHNHDATYAAANHNHSGVYAPISAAGQTNFWIDAGEWIETTAGVATDLTPTQGIGNDWLVFDNAEDQFAFCTRVMPNNYNPALGYTAKFHWEAADGTEGVSTCCFGITAAVIGDGDESSVTLGTYQTATDTFLGVGKRHISDPTTSTLVGGSPAAGEEVVFAVMRDVSGGTLAVEAKLRGVEIAYNVELPA